MRILSFQERYIDDILRGRKETTIRKTPRFDHYYQFWSPGPRTGRGQRRGTLEVLAIEWVFGRNLTELHARRDCVGTLHDLLHVLSDYNDMTMDEVLAHRWPVHDIQLVDNCPQCLKPVKARVVDAGYTDIDCPIHGKGRWSH